jgi:entericidin A
LGTRAAERFTRARLAVHRFDAGFTHRWGLMARGQSIAGCHFVRPVTITPTEQGAAMKRLLALILISLFSLGTLSACNTMAGVGEDIEAVGEKIEDKAEDCKDPPC